MKLRAFAAVVITATVGLISAGPASGALTDVPTPEVSGPVPVTATSYPFLSSDKDLASYGYVEHEYFITGDAYRYETSGSVDNTADRIETGGAGDDGAYPFKTRIVVRRPAAAADANGAVVAEWNNVTATQDIEWNWFGDPEFLMENGYTFVGVTAQNTGVNSLLAFDPARYAGLTVNGNNTVPTGKIDPNDPASPSYDADALSFDVFSSAIKAVIGEGTGVDPLGGINAQTVIASGESQSCGRLASHYNKIQPIHEIVDAYLLTVCGSSLRTDRPEKAIRVLSETENRTPRSAADHPDTASIRHWEVAAGSHLPRMAFDNINGVLTRDFLGLTVTCEKFPLSLVEWPFTANRATDALVKWANGAGAPPVAPRGEYVPNPDYDSSQPASPANPERILDRDRFGIAKGGIRYPAVTVPTALNDGTNAAGEGGSPFSAFCGLLGSSTPFTDAQLTPLYRDFADYLEKYDAAADAMIPDGFVMAQDVPRLKANARQFAEIRPTAPALSGKTINRGTFGFNWTGTQAPDTTFELQRSTGSGWTGASFVLDDSAGREPILARLTKEPEGTFSYRVRSSTVLPGTNISDPRTVTTPFSDGITGIKVDRSGPKAPRVVVKGRKFRRPGKNGRKGRVIRNTYVGKARVRVIGRADVKLPDGSSGTGLNRKSVPKTRVIRKKGRTVIKVRTRDKLGNRSRVVRKVIRIKKAKKGKKRSPGRLLSFR
ncbi:MAG: alpha/beta hydrolase domain-containing protein [Actinomycetota bacterium]|nr:alpha/beta hydrolase domain-containing protein [Actinomycetota bacterium]